MNTLIHINATVKELGTLNMPNHAFDGMRLCRSIKPAFERDDRRLIVVLNKYNEVLHHEFTLPGDEYYGSAVVSTTGVENYTHMLSIEDDNELEYWFYHNKV